MAINPLLLNVKPISEITTVDNPIKGHLLFYDGSDELKKVDIIKFQSLIGGIAKPLAITDATPTTPGWYKPTTSGTYANAGGLVAQDGYDTLFYFDGTTWSKVEVAIPTALSAVKVEHDTIANLQNDINHVADTLAIVRSEINPFWNGVYKKIGGVGSGGWERTEFANPVFRKADAPENMSIGGGLTSVYKEAGTPGSGEGNITFGLHVGENIGAGWANILFGYNVGNALAEKSVVNSWSKQLGNVGNIFFGYNVGNVANGALDNTIVGNSSGMNLTKGMDNSIFGVWAGRLIEEGSENAFYGHLTGGYVVGKGDEANIDSTVTDPNSPQYSWGHRITALGNLAGALDLGGNALTYIKKNVYVGSHTRGNNWTYNENVFGYKAQGRGTNTVSIGNNEVKETHFYGVLSNWCDRTVSQLPAPTRALLGARSFVLDANTRTFDAIVGGGGRNIVPVWCDGSSWRVG